MKTPKLRKLRELNIGRKTFIEEAIKKTLESDFIISYPIEEFTILELDILTEYAKVNDIFIALKAEHSNLHQGVLVELLKRELTREFIKYL